MKHQPLQIPHRDPFNANLIDTLWLRMIDAAQEGKPSDAKACLDLIERIEARILAAKCEAETAANQDHPALLRDLDARFTALAVEA